MLVLSRRINESIIIGDDIEIKILKVEGKTVKIGISAPKSVKIYRKEIYDSIKRENIEAMKSELTEGVREILGGVRDEDRGKR